MQSMIREAIATARCGLATGDTVSGVVTMIDVLYPLLIAEQIVTLAGGKIKGWKVSTASWRHGAQARVEGQ